MNRKENRKEKQKAEQQQRQYYQQSGNLTAAEVDELIGYDFHTGPASIRQQFRNYFLRVKCSDQQRAALMLERAEPLLCIGVQSEQEVHDLSVIVNEYVSDFVFLSELTPEMTAEMKQDYDHPLKTITRKAEVPYKVWRQGRGQTALWKAWRQGRPMVSGYGMTEDEAMKDLRYNVSPDHTGELDGLGKPEGPVFGGNMFSDVQGQNQKRFEGNLPYYK